MIAALGLWTHALAALLYGALALWALRARPVGVPRLLLGLALALTSLWALAVAGIGPLDLSTQLVEGLRNFGWLALMFVVQRRDAAVRPRLALALVYGVVAAVVAASMVLSLLADTAPAARVEAFASAALLFRMLAAVTALVLVQGLYAATGRARAGLRAIVLALAGMWLADLNFFGIAYLIGYWPIGLAAFRGAVMVLLAASAALGIQREDSWRVQVSRTVAYQSLSLVAICLYFVLLGLATSALATVGGENARVLQTAFVFGSTVAILSLVSSTWLRAWVKVKLAKHFFRHRYDYRAEWTRFTETLGAPGGGATLDERIVKAIADLTDSPGGVLLVPEGVGLGLGAAWRWEGDLPLSTGTEEALVQHIAATGRIIEIDALRGDTPDLEDLAAIPRWMLDVPTAWALVPLPHMGRIAGAILLARPPVARALDWEDFDLLKVAGQQAASYLAEARAQERLAEAERFDEFNRRFAFILHDIKNLVSQITLLARNAERHADNPDFRADMIATLRESSERMNGLLARLSQPHRAPLDEAMRAVAVAPLLERMAARAAHPVTSEGDAAVLARADPARLEQLLRHLLQNAIEASPADATIRLAIARNEGEVWIDVIDQGCGMSPAFVRDKLFKPFVSSKPAGFGIGAFEARQLATAMGGRIDVVSREGQGTRFRVVLPVARSEPGLGRAA